MTMAQKSILQKHGHSNSTDKRLSQNSHNKKKTLNMAELTEYYKQKSLQVRLPLQSHNRKQTFQSAHKLKLPPIDIKAKKDTKSNSKAKETKLPLLPSKKESARRKQTIVIVANEKPPEKIGGITGNSKIESKNDNIDSKNHSKKLPGDNIIQEVKNKLESQRLQLPILVDSEEPTNIPKQRTRMSQSEYSKQIKSRRKLAWKAQREKANLFNIDLVDLHRSMLTSSATMRGLMKLNASEVVIYRFRLSNYNMIDIQY